MPDYDLHFSPFSTDENASFKLLELPSELATLVENALQSKSDSLDLVIKGETSEDAVLCTRDKTYSIRAVNLSNTLLVVTPPPDTDLVFPEDAVVIRDQVNEILEVAPTVPRITKLVGCLRGREYDETHEDDDEGDDADTGNDEGNQRYTYRQARVDIQASDAELDLCLKQKRILIINDELRPISPAYLNSVLQLTLNILVSDNLPHAAASVERLTTALAGEHGVSRVVSAQVLAWFGEIHAGKWKMDVEEVIKELGLGILRRHRRDDPIEKGQFITEWKDAVGDTFAERVTLKLLAGNYLEHTTLGSTQQRLSYFPASALPADPAARFADLFLTRTRWRVEDITPFLSDIAVNSKERDKLLLKYCRAITEGGAVWYTARAQYNG